MDILERMNQRWQRFRSWSAIRLLFLFILGLSCVLFACATNGVPSLSGASTSSSVPNLAVNPTTCGSPSGGPRDNPVASRYAEASAWTEQIQWDCVYNIGDFEGATDTDRFNAARDAAIAHGGGVVYLLISIEPGLNL